MAIQRMSTCSQCGTVNEDRATNCWECGMEMPVPSVGQPAIEVPPDLPAPELIRAAELEPAFKYEDGFHRADWDCIGRWIETNVAPINGEHAWNEAVLFWVTKLRDDLGGGYFVLQSPHVILLCDQSLESARWMLKYTGDVAFRIKECLGDTAWADSFGKDVVLVFSDLDDYYQYLSFHSIDGEQAASGGVCIHSGCIHIALPWQDATDAANTIVHEMTHDCLSHLPLPLWLNEGVAVTLQKLIAPPQRAVGQGDQDMIFAAAIDWRPPIMWEELAERHFAFWTEQNIQSFWAGTSFFESGDSNELSYSLAEVIVKLLTEKGDGSAFRAFLESAQSGDAGQTAAMDALGVDLGELAGTFLGKGDWRPRRKALVECWEASGWRKNRNSEGDHGAAEADAQSPG